MTKKIPVMVTGVGGGGHGEQILKALLMADTPYEIVGGDMNPCSKGLTDVDHAYVLPPATAPEYIDRVLDICARHDVMALFHGCEPELKVFSENRETIESRGIFLPINPALVIERCMDKDWTSRWLTEHGFSVPRTYLVKSDGDLKAIDHFPLILKPHVGSGGSNNTYIVQNRDELQLFGRFQLQAIGTFIAQEYVGRPDDEYTVGILHDLDGDFINSIAVKRMVLSGLGTRMKTPNRTGDDRFGNMLVVSSGISQGDIGPYPEVTRPCEEIARELGSLGALNIQCRLFEGRVYVFEINPRFSGTTSLRALAGYNEPDILIRRHLLGESVTARFPYRSGTIMRGLVESFSDPGRVRKCTGSVGGNDGA